MNMPGVADLSNDLALDVQGLDRLKRHAHQDGQANLKEASRQFEALFLQKMLKSMRDAIPKSELSNNSQTEFYTEMLDQQLAQSLAGKGMGLAEQLTRQLSGHLGKTTASDEQLLDPNRTLFMQTPAAPQSPWPVQAIDAWKRRQVGGIDDDQPEHVQAFIEQLREPVQKAARASGLPAELILAQAALETDWGRRGIRTASGADSHNLFGIKAGGQWQGESTLIMTTEFVDGQAQKQQDSFRVYPDFDAAFSDYARLIRNRPSYAAARNASNAPQAAMALQQGGYATDPQYGQKLISVMATIGPLHSVPDTAQARP